MGRNLIEMMPKPEADAFVACAELALEKGVMQFLDYSIQVRGSLRLREARFVANGEDEVLILVRDVTERNRTQEALLESERKYRALFDQSADAIFLVGRDGAVLELNQSGCDLLGYGPEDFRTLFAKDALATKEEHDELMKKLMEDGSIKDFEVRLVTKQGQLLDGMITASTLRDENGTVIANHGIMRDITAQKRYEARLRASLEEKEILLKEINHRVKNNLQIISSLLSLQSSNITDPLAQNYFRISQDRIKAMALIHEKLYQSEDLARIDFGDYLETLAPNLHQSYGNDTQNIELNIDAEFMLLGVDVAIPCGLIVNELISNSLKHAFPGNRSGAITVEAHTAGGTHTLVVRDNGIGIPENLDIGSSDSLGFTILNALSGQVRGTVEVENNDGALFRITFPAESVD